MITLPPRDTARWTARRKALVAAAVTGGEISESAACARWDLSPEELSAWIRDFSRHGVDGLRTTRVQFYRNSES